MSTEKIIFISSEKEKGGGLLRREVLGFAHLTRCRNAEPPQFSAALVVTSLSSPIEQTFNFESVGGWLRREVKSFAHLSRCFNTEPPQFSAAIVHKVYKVYKVVVIFDM